MEIQEKLEERLKNIYDDEDFVLGVMTNVKSDKGRIKIIDFIDMASRRQDDITPSDIAALSVIIGEENMTSD